MNKKKQLDAIRLMWEIRDRLAKEEEGLTWEERKKKLYQDLEGDAAWKRLKAVSRPAVSGSPTAKR
jgi:hypothetical protein